MFNKKIILHFLFFIGLQIYVESKFEELELQIQPKKIDYDPSKIDEIIQKLGIPKNFDFIKEENLDILDYVKDQKDCGSCWSMAETTALSYRFYKQTKTEVNLTAQYPLDCFSKDCHDGPSPYEADFLIDLIVNGTVTENCFPYIGTVTKCPFTCKDGSQLVKYKAKNIYILPEVSLNNYYNIVEIILYQLYNYGPVTAGVLVDVDFSIFGDKSNKQKCKESIFIHDENYINGKGHSIVIIGYGYSEIESKYYWLAQNSWGKDFCDNGIIKIGFGQIDIEHAFEFFEVNIKSDTTIKKSIPLNFMNINGDNCKINIEISEDALKDMEDSFKIVFKNDKTSKNFIYICGSTSLPEKKIFACYYESKKFEVLEKGYYKFFSLDSLGDTNEFLYSSFSGKGFEFSGKNYITSYANNYYYISGEKSKIILSFIPDLENFNMNLPSIYANSNFDSPLENCGHYKIGSRYIIYCTINVNELEYFKYYENGIIEMPLFYSKYCGEKISTNLNVYRLDKNKYPVFYIDKLILPNQEIYSGRNIALKGYIRGTIPKLKEDKYNEFELPLYIKMKSVNDKFKLYCQFLFRTVEQYNKEFEIKCGIISDYQIKKEECIEYRIDPLFLPLLYAEPYEVIVLSDIKVVNSESTFLDYLSFKRLLSFIYICLFVF